MPRCPCCFGERLLDFRDLDAALAELLDDDALEVARAGPNWMAVIGCPECEATGVVSPERLAELNAAARASVEQAIASVLGPPPAAPPEPS